MEREANNEKIVCLFFLCTWPTLSVDAVGKDLMTKWEAFTARPDDICVLRYLGSHGSRLH